MAADEFIDGMHAAKSLRDEWLAVDAETLCHVARSLVETEWQKGYAFALYVYAERRAAG